MERAKYFNAFLDVADELRDGSGIGQCGVTGDEGFEGLIDFAPLDTEKKSLQLFLHGGGRRLGVGVSGQKLGNESGDLGQIGGGTLIGRRCPEGGAHQDGQKKYLFHVRRLLSLSCPS